MTSGTALHNVTAWLLLLLVCLMQTNRAAASTQCHNGGTFDYVAWTCLCTPDFYGPNCETSFISSDPCSNPSIPELNDAAGAHSPNNSQACASSGGCIDFSTISPGWHRLKSPAGGVLSTACLSSTGSCGSSYPYILTNIVQEANANRDLRSGRLYAANREAPVCFDSSSSSYPVRILRCASFQLYYLRATSSPHHHYCIGDKVKCSAGLVSSDGSGYEPCYDPASCLPKLKPGALPPAMEQVRIDRGPYRDSYFNCTVQDSYETNQTGGVLYQVTYRLTFHNGTKILFYEDNCTVNGLAIASGGSANVFCHFSPHELPAHTNIYGGTLECIVKAKCNMAAANYISLESASLPHSFAFEYKLVDPDAETGADKAVVITPSKPIQLCINISKVPFDGLAELRVSVKRQALIAKDLTNIKINSSIGNGSSNSSDPCVITFQGMLRRYSKICTTLVLLNDDEEGLVIYGLDSTQLTPMVEVNVSYRSTSSARGVFTNGQLIRLQSRQLMVDLRPLYGLELKDYLHLFSDPFVKPANSLSKYEIYHSMERYSCRSISVMKHSVLPYEVQIKECHDMPLVHSRFTELAIRYEYYLIRISSKGGVFSYQTTKLDESALPLSADNEPRGVIIERTNTAMRVKFELYGTIFYIYGFMTNAPAYNTLRSTDYCIHNFIMTRKAMKESNCHQSSHSYVWPGYDGFDAFDMSVIPGFYDTPNRIDGIMFRPNFASWKSTDVVAKNSSRDMFSPNFVAERVQENLLKPTEWVNFCSCNDAGTAESDTPRCAINVDTIGTRTKRSVNRARPIRASRSIESPAAPAGQQTEKITNATAAEHCNNFVQVMAGLSKSVTVAECSNSSGILQGSADYISQFKTVCAMYAVQLNTFNYTEPVFNSFINRCLMSLSFNVPVVQHRAATLQVMQEELCPSNCSGNGDCYAGACQCRSGFAGSACQVSTSGSSGDSGSSVSVEVVTVDLYGIGPLCSSRNCTAIYLSVSPYLRSANPTCVIRSAGSEGFEERIASQPLASNVVGCPVAGAVSWIQTNNRLYMSVLVHLTASDWSSNNTASALVYLESCEYGRAVCSSNTMTCVATDMSWTDVLLSNFCAGAGVISGAAGLTVLMAAAVLLLSGWDLGAGQLTD